MSNQTIIQAVLESNGIQLRGEVVSDQANPADIYASINYSRDSGGKVITPSYTSLRKARDELSQMGFQLKFLLHSDVFTDLESGLRATLLSAFPAQIRNSFMATSGPNAHVWVESKVNSAKEHQNEIKIVVQEYFSRTNLTFKSLNWLDEERLPGKLALLKVIRTLAPASDAQITAALLQKAFVIPSPEWMRRTLDKLRKSEDIVQLTGQRYALPLSTVRRLGTAKGRASPDISRLLAIKPPRKLV